MHRLGSTPSIEACNAQSRSVSKIGAHQLPPILITRPIAPSQSFAETLIGHGVAPADVIVSPVLRIEPTAFDPETRGIDGFIFTSAHAVRQAAQHIPPEHRRRAFCVGRQTTQLALDLGFSAEFCGQNIDQFVRSLTQRDTRGTLLYLRGRHVTADLGSLISSSGVTLQERIVYDQLAQNLSKQACDNLRGGTGVVVPLFSSRTAHILVGQPIDWSQHRAIAISPKVADVCKAVFGQTIVAERPDVDAMAEAVVK